MWPISFIRPIDVLLVINDGDISFFLKKSIVDFMPMASFDLLIDLLVMNNDNTNK